MPRVQHLPNASAYVNSWNKFGVCSFDRACSDGYANIVQILLTQGKPMPDECDEHGLSLLFAACKHAHENTSKLAPSWMWEISTIGLLCL